MAEPGDTGGIVKRTADYPYPNPGHSFVQLGDRSEPLPPGGPDLRGRTALLAYGANASPAVLARKLAALPELELPLILAELDGFDVVYSAHVSPYGAIPATLQRSPGTTATVYVAYPTAEQLALLSATEPNYELRTLSGVSCRLDSGGSIGAVSAYLSRHGCLLAGGTEVALSAVPAHGRGFPQMDQAEVRELVGSLAPADFPRTAPFFT